LILKRNLKKDLYTHEVPSGGRRFGFSLLEGILSLIALIGAFFFIYFFFLSQGNPFQSERKAFRERFRAVDLRVNALEDNLKNLKLQQEETVRKLDTLLARTREQEKKAAEVKETPPSKKPARISVKVKKGETLKGLAQRYNVSEKEIITWNKLGERRGLKMGETLILYKR
jgi:hypothetical protein